MTPDLRTKDLTKRKLVMTSRTAGISKKKSLENVDETLSDVLIRVFSRN